MVFVMAEIQSCSYGIIAYFKFFHSNLLKICNKKDFFLGK